MTTDSKRRPRVKVCGLTRAQDAELALSLGADELGCVLAPESPRYVTAENARALLTPLAAEARGVLVFRSPSLADVLSAVETSGIEDVQLHRSSIALAASLEARGCRVRRAFDAPFSDLAYRLAHRRSNTQPIVLDVAGGGSGQSFPTTLLIGRDVGNAYVAGGLDAANVGDVLTFRPLGLDLSSRLERCPGEKDPDRMRAFFEALHSRLLHPQPVTPAEPDRIR